MIELDESHESIACTQPLETNEDYITASQFSYGSNPYWGRLYPLTRFYKHHDLVADTITLGTELCTINVCKVQLDINNHVCVDRKQFEICRSSCKVKTRTQTKVKIHCLGKFDIFVNDTRLKRKSLRGNSGAPCDLRHNDIISFAMRDPKSKFEAFVFIDAQAPRINHIPMNIHLKYDVAYRLGMGAFGEVYLAFNKESGRASAMKSILKNPLADIRENHNRAKLLNEIDIIKSVEHPHITILLDELEYNKDTYMFLEYMEGKDLSMRISSSGKLNESEAKLIFYQIVTGVEYLHDRKIIHRDIKPANVLMASCSSEALVKLTDFGLSKILCSSSNMRTVCGTKMYAAPELLSAGGQKKYNAKVDVWSLGVLLFVSLSGTEPFAVQPHLVDEHISKGLYVMDPQEWRNVSVYAKNLIDDMLVPDANQRIDIATVRKNNWLQDCSMQIKLKQIYNFYGIVDNYSQLSIGSPPLKKLRSS